MAMDEESIEQMESQVPEWAQRAVEKAFQRALDAGQSVLIAEGDAIYEVFPDRSKKFVKRVEPATPVKAGTIIKLR